MLTKEDKTKALVSSVNRLLTGFDTVERVFPADGGAGEGKERRRNSGRQTGGRG